MQFLKKKSQGGFFERFGAFLFIFPIFHLSLQINHVFSHSPIKFLTLCLAQLINRYFFYYILTKN